jgi:mxaJ protein
MKRRLATLGVAALLCALTATAVAADIKALRVCGDPDNLPFSNQKLEGFENKIADLIASELGTTTTYFWWQHQRGLVRNTFDADLCDVVMGIPKGYDLVLWTKPYYRTGYVLAYRKDRAYHLASLDAPELKKLRIGVYYNTPPQEALATRDIIANVATTYSLFFDLEGDIESRPARLFKDLVAGNIDVAIPYGPQAGYYIKKLNAPLELVPLEGTTAVPLAFDISMGVKKGNQALKRDLEGALDRRQADIRKILEDYGVPLMPAHQTPPAAAAARTIGAVGTSGILAAQGSAPAAKKNPFTGNADAIADGKKMFVQNGCSGCHGVGGGGGMGPSLIDDEWKFGSDDETLFKLIKGDIPDQTMPKVYNVLPDEEVWKLLAFVRSIYAGDPAKVNW